MFTPMKTGTSTMTGGHKILIYANAGWGKTSQALNFKRRWGDGFVLSGESGLRTLGHEEIDYIPFNSWDGTHDDALKVYSFLGSVRDIMTPDFAARGYNWIMVDSLTEVSDLLMAALQEKHKGNKNRFELWGDYATQMIGVLKIIRDLPYHVIMTALMKSDTDDNNFTSHGPAIKGNAVASQLCGIMDHVIAGVKPKDGNPEEPDNRRLCIVDEVRGYTAKLRDPYRRFSERPIVETSDVTNLIAAITMSPSEWDEYQTKRAKAQAIAEEAIANAKK